MRYYRSESGPAAPLTRRGFLQCLLLGLGAAACRLMGIQPGQPGSIPQAASPQAAASPRSLSTPVSQTPFNPATTAPPTAEAAVASPAHTATGTATPSPTPARAARFLIDGHQDIAWNALEFGRDIRRSAFEIRAQEDGSSLPGQIGLRAAGLPEYLEGRVGIIFASLFVMPAGQSYAGRSAMIYRTPEEAEARAREQAAYYHELAGPGSTFRLLRSLADLQEVTASWAAGRGRQVGLVLAMEGAEPIRDPDDLESWHADGLRIVGPAWAATRYAGSSSQPGPLTLPGKRLLERMAGLQMALDLSHLAERAFYQALEAYPGPIIASHSNPRKYLPTERGLSDEMIRELAKRDGVVGIVPYNRYLKPGWQPGEARAAVTLQTFAEAIDYVVQIAGSARSAAAGSDLDGGFGAESLPQGMDSAADLIKVGAALEKMGYEPEAVDLILNGNWLRVLEQCLPA